MNEEIAKALERAHRVLIITHIDPDGDAIGSLLGLGLALEKMGKKVTMACENPVPRRFLYLPGSDRVVPYPMGSFEIVVALDASDLRRLGKAYSPELYGELPLINIDHHVTNPGFGTLNWVDPEAAATAQIVLELVEGMGAPLEPDVATCLLNGIVTDTRGFRTVNTTPQTLEAALKLQRAGANLVEVMENVFDRRPLGVLRLWAHILSQAQLEDRIIWAEKPRSLLEKFGLNDEGNYGLTNFMVGVEEADVAVIFSEKPGGEIDVSMRSVPGVDVSKVAAKLGGGGHPQAAGCRLKGTFQEVREKVLKELRKAL
ncbi:MAG TPA: bifunctional oligoribonuclease/PAP phosphatase NrnA [Chloroflexi bacterium]|nr:bifunctional oligoribonuclease/PAP phosphatase NrnA [Chloroflexota bacterium]